MKIRDIPNEHPKGVVKNFGSRFLKCFSTIFNAKILHVNLREKIRKCAFIYFNLTFDEKLLFNRLFIIEHDVIAH